ncbi:Na(+)/citrate cotransporter isoform X4 [Apus apus]|uniref:Na(+)/citrate cotransporter isoform X4 n=1 Tax=Apus apus TaxID=8895 RepID=UPI0021F872CE|nr:Na(+)/citrate cotransporter isoform X4 [Apus apus]
MAPTCLRPLLRYRSFGILFLTPLLLLPLPVAVPTREAKCAYIIIIMAVYWCTEVIPLAVTSLMPVVFFPLLGVQSSKSVCLQYLNDTNMLFVGGLIVAISVEQWNLHKRIALRVLLIVGVKPALLMLGFMIVTAFLSMWISNTATTAMMVPIVQAVLDQMDNTEYDVTMMEQAPGQTNTVIELEEKNTSDPTSVHVISNGQVPDDPRASEEKNLRKRICKGMTLCVCYAASIGGTATLTGTGPNMVLKGQMNQHPGFVKGWAARLFPEGEKYITDSAPAVFIALLLFILPANKPKFIGWNPSMSDPEQTEEDIKKPFLSAPLLDWNVVQRKMPWSIVLLLGGGFALADASANSGLSAWLGHQMTPLGSIPPWAIATVLSLIIAVFTECTSNVATATLFLPVFSSMAASVKIHPLYVMLPGTLSASFAFMLPVATPPNAIVFSYGHIRVLDMVRSGIVMNIIGVFCVTLAINTWGRPMFELDTFPTWANSTTSQ